MNDAVGRHVCQESRRVCQSFWCEWYICKSINLQSRRTPHNSTPDSTTTTTTHLTLCIQQTIPGRLLSSKRPGTEQIIHTTHNSKYPFNRKGSSLEVRSNIRMHYLVARLFPEIDCLSDLAYQLLQGQGIVHVSAEQIVVSAKRLHLSPRRALSPACHSPPGICNKLVHACSTYNWTAASRLLPLTE